MQEMSNYITGWELKQNGITSLTQFEEVKDTEPYRGRSLSGFAQKLLK